MRFRATILVWDRWGNIGVWVWKGNDVAIAVSKATHDAYKNIKQVPITLSWSIPYSVTCKYKACLVMLRPAGSGTWLKAWSSVRVVLELAWYLNILSKIIGSGNSLNNAIAVINALTSFKVNADKVQEAKKLVKEVVQKKENKRTDRKDTRKKIIQRPKKQNILVKEITNQDENAPTDQTIKKETE